MLEINTFLLTRATQHYIADNSQANTNPLIYVQSFAKDKQRTDKHEDWTRGIDRTIDSERNMLHSKVCEKPRGKYDETLHQNVLMHLPPYYWHIEHTAVETRSVGTQENERKEYQRTEECVEEKYWKHRVSVECLFLEYIIESEQCCGCES